MNKKELREVKELLDDVEHDLVLFYKSYFERQRVFEGLCVREAESKVKQALILLEE